MVPLPLGKGFPRWKPWGPKGNFRPIFRLFGPFAPWKAQIMGTNPWNNASQITWIQRKAPQISNRKPKGQFTRNNSPKGTQMGLEFSNGTKFRVRALDKGNYPNVLWRKREVRRNLSHGYDSSVDLIKGLRKYFHFYNEDGPTPRSTARHP